ncbi:helix-turn-helix domain-containing protein [Nocardia terrae]|uniref:helix-turn-helix domain-containing protein n=1 Tax=Nocardia terrae TaxID=2675851 RepID=UPI0018DF0792|nr:helix-turn-helix domain-containing protein [Nocardia terrae]
MGTLLDTDDMPAQDRLAAITEAVHAAAAPHHVIAEPGQPIRARFEAWDFGGAGIYRIVRSSGIRMVRTAPQIRRGPSPAFVVALRERGVAYRNCGEVQDRIEPGQLFAVDMNAPFDIGWRRTGAHTALMVPLDALAMSAETVRRGVGNLPASPLYSVMSGFIASMVASADELGADAAGREIAAACTEMVRALLASAVGKGAADGGAIPAELLLTQIREYIRANLADPELGAESIARAHSISLRQLYKLCASAGVSLEQSIIANRLERVRAELSSPAHSHLSIASVAGRWGFRDPSHFARRFRAAYGITPREWRQASGTGAR